MDLSDPNPVPSGPGPSVLVVDDEPSVLTTYRLVLEHHGFAVTAAPTAAEAVAALEQRKFDILLCDLTLRSGSNGFDVVAAARRLPAPPRCALLTGYALPELSERAARESVTLLFKPIHAHDLLAALRDLLGRRAAGAE